MAVVDDYSPITVGDTLTPLSCVFQSKDGTPQPLTGATFGLVLLSTTGQRKVGAGTWTIDNAAGGQAHYVYNAADVNTPGTWSIQVAITISGQTTHFDVKPLEIDEAL